MSNVIRLGDYITEISEKTTVNNQHMVLTSSQEGIVSQDDYFNKQVASKDNTGYKIICRGQFTYRAMSDTGRFYINRLTDYDIGIVSPAYPVFELRTNGQILPEYLQEYFHSEHFQNAITLSSTGSTRVSLKLAKIADLRIDIPTLPKQQCAVQAISHVNHLISMQNSSAAKLDQLVKSRFVEMFGGIHDSALYPYMTVDSFTKVTSGGTPDRNTPSYWENGKIRWVKTTELQNCVICDTEERITDDGVENSSAKMVPANTILIAMYGQGKTRGMTGYLAVECTTNQACACILPSEGINQKYLWQYMMLSYDKLRGMAKGGNQPNLNAGLIKSFPVLLPPLELQNRFAAFVAEVDKSKLAVKQSLEKLETLKKSLMQQYFG